MPMLGYAKSFVFFLELHGDQYVYRLIAWLLPDFVGLIGFFDVSTCPGLHLGDKTSLFIYNRHLLAMALDCDSGDMMLLGYLHVFCTKGRGNVYDACAFFCRDKIAWDDAKGRCCGLYVGDQLFVFEPN